MQCLIADQKVGVCRKRRGQVFPGVLSETSASCGVLCVCAETRYAASMVRSPGTRCPRRPRSVIPDVVASNEGNQQDAGHRTKLELAVNRVLMPVNASSVGSGEASGRASDLPPVRRAASDRDRSRYWMGRRILETEMRWCLFGVSAVPDESDHLACPHRVANGEPLGDTVAEAIVGPWRVVVEMQIQVPAPSACLRRTTQQSLPLRHCSAPWPAIPTPVSECGPSGCGRIR